MCSRLHIGQQIMVQLSTSDLQPFLDRLISRSILTAEEQEAILGLPTTAFKAGRNEDFVKLGEPVRHCSFIVAGIVGRFDQNSNGERQITAVHLAGDIPDLLSVVQPKPTSALQALSATTILRIKHQALRDVAARHPAIAEAFWRDCTVDAMVMAQWLVNLGRRDAKARLAHLLCELALRLKADVSAQQVEFRLAMTQEHIANVTGLSLIHVNRSLMALRGIGTQFRSGVVSIQNWQHLQHLGDFDPTYLQLDLRTDQRLRIVAPAP